MMKLKNPLFCMAMFMSCLALNAQTMTDSQVIEYGKQRQVAGADARTIGAELLSQGATREQLERLVSSYGRGNSASQSNTTIAIDRSRVDNGEAFPSQSAGSTGRKIFGHDIFRSRLLSFEPNVSMAIPASYSLGAGDEIIIDVYGASNSSLKIKVAPDGSINVPRIGPIAVSGLSVAKAQERICESMSSHYENSSIKVSVGQTRAISISVMGEVQTPGTYTLSAFATVFHALYMAGGINSLGTLREVKVARNGRIVSTIDVYEYILNGRLDGDIKLRDNDVIMVGSYENLVHVTGNVKRPMWYEMKKNETLGTLLSFCDGFKGDAYTKNLSVVRSAGEKLSVHTVPESDFPFFRLMDGDEISVGANEQRYYNIVSVRGAVKRSGDYELKETKTVLGLIETAGGLQEYAKTNRAVLTRMNPDRTRKTISVSLSEIMDGTAEDIELENEDILYIGSWANINDDRTLSITGEVFFPGTFNYADNTTIEDLITRAGGLTVSASLLNVEVARRIIDPSAPTDTTVRSEVFKFNLDPDLSIEGQNDFILKPYDRVHVRRSPAYSTQHTVNITGEVVFAGRYTLKDNKVCLSEIIKQAGGFKKNASVHDARLIRTANETELVRSKQIVEMARDAVDSISIRDIRPTGTYSVAIDLEKAMREPGGKYDILLRDGDEIIVPQMINTVKISGEVLYPNSVTFVSGENRRYYINEAGGFTKKSLRRRAYIIYANGNVSRLSKGRIEPGCEIVVPVKEERIDHTNNLVKWASICSSLTTAAAVVISIF